MIRNIGSPTDSKGLNFDGVNDLVLFPYNPLIDFTNATPFTISLKVRNYFTTNNVLYSYFNLMPLIAGNNRFFIAYNNGFIIFALGNFNGIENIDYVVLVHTLPIEQRFEDIVATIKYDGISLYTLIVNGTTITKNATLTPLVTNKILGYTSLAQQFFGIMKDVKIWNRELTPAEVSNVEDTIYPNDFVFNNEFDNNEGFVLTDKANGYNGTLVNYALSDTQPGPTNSWRYSNEVPYDGSQRVYKNVLIRNNKTLSLR